MTREEKLHFIAQQMIELVGKMDDVAICLDPNTEFGVLVRGKIDMKVLAEWVLARMG